MRVHVRKKAVKNGKHSINLDTYYNGKHHIEFLKLYTIDKPKNEQEKIHNVNVKTLADKSDLTEKQILSIQNIKVSALRSLSLDF